jgi:hypothetical protein
MHAHSRLPPQPAMSLLGNREPPDAVTPRELPTSGNVNGSRAASTDVALKLVARPSPLRINRNRASKMGASENPGRAAPTVSSPRHARESFPSVR